MLNPQWIRLAPKFRSRRNLVPRNAGRPPQMRWNKEISPASNPNVVADDAILTGTAAESKSSLTDVKQRPKVDRCNTGERDEGKTTEVVLTASWEQWKAQGRTRDPRYNRSGSGRASDLRYAGWTNMKKGMHKEGAVRLASTRQTELTKASMTNDTGLVCPRGSHVATLSAGREVVPVIARNGCMPLSETSPGYLAPHLAREYTNRKDSFRAADQEAALGYPLRTGWRWRSCTLC
jgi:hypothetical protein